jgi:hypothetical protein
MTIRDFLTVTFQEVKDVLSRRRQLHREQRAGANYWQQAGGLKQTATSAYLLTVETPEDKMMPELRRTNDVHLRKLFETVPPYARQALRDQIMKIQLSAIFRDEDRDYSRSPIGEPRPVRRLSRLLRLGDRKP